jgi:hypothetical protein
VAITPTTGKTNPTIFQTVCGAEVKTRRGYCLSLGRCSSLKGTTPRDYHYPASVIHGLPKPPANATIIMLLLEPDTDAARQTDTSSIEVK